LILSINIIASLITIQVRDINHIANGILYGCHRAYNHKLTQRRARTTEYNIIAGCEYELN